MKNKKKLTGSDIGVLLSIIGIIASLMVIILNVINGESITVGIALLCSCSATLSTNVRNKRNEK